MKQAIQTALTTIPPTALFLIGLIAGTSYGLFRLLGALNEAGLNG